MLAAKAAELRGRLARVAPDLAVVDYRPGDDTVRVAKPGAVRISCAFDESDAVETILFCDGLIDHTSKERHTSLAGLVHYMQYGYHADNNPGSDGVPMGPYA